MVGEGTQRQRTEELAESLGLPIASPLQGGRGVGARRAVQGRSAIVFAPFDEDYGYVTLESFLAHKPVITTPDAGGPLEFVRDDDNGLICEPTAGGHGRGRESPGRRQGSCGAFRRRRLRTCAAGHMGRRD